MQAICPIASCIHCITGVKGENYDPETGSGTKLHIDPLEVGDMLGNPTSKVIDLVRIRTSGIQSGENLVGKNTIYHFEKYVT